MEQIDVKVKKWGNSFGIILPMKIVEKEKLKEGSEISLNIKTKRAMTGADLMELGKKLGIAGKFNGITLRKEIKRIQRELWEE